MYKAQLVFCLLLVISYAFAASLDFESVGSSSAHHDDGNTGLPQENVTDPQLKITTTLNRFGAAGDDNNTNKSMDNQNDEADDDDDDENEENETEEDEDDDEYDESRPKSKNIEEEDPASYDSTYDDTDK